MLDNIMGGVGGFFSPPSRCIWVYGGWVAVTTEMVLSLNGGEKE